MTSPIRQVGTGHLSQNATFPAATLPGRVLFAWCSGRGSDVAEAAGWTPLSSLLHAPGDLPRDSGRWFYGTSASGTVVQVLQGSWTNVVCWETTIDAATFNPATVTVYETDLAATSTDLNLGAVTSPTGGQIILYGCTYRHDAGGLISAPGAGWSVDYNIHTTDPNGHPYILGMRWDGTTTPLTGSATVASSPYCGAMLQSAAAPLPVCDSPVMFD